MISVDIRTRFIAQDQRCYILFPGMGYRFYGAMEKEAAIWLDLPGFELGQKEDITEVKDLLERVSVSSKIADWHRGGRPSQAPPPRSVKELGRIRRTTQQQQYAGLVRGFFSQIRPGDVVIVPASSYEEDVLFGEVLPGRVDITYPAYGDDKIPALKVRWVARMRRDAIPSWLERKIPSPNPLRQIEKSYFDSIFDIMYERYFYDGKFVCKFDIKSQEFSALDNFLFQQVVLYTAALHEAREEDNIDEVGKQPIWSVVAGIEFSDDIPDQRISINSPGHIVVYSKNIIPIVAAVMIALSASGATAADLQTAGIVIENSADKSQASRECVADVNAEVIDDLTAMGYNRWKELCQIAEQQRKRTELSSGMSVEPREPTTQGKPTDGK